MWKYSKQPFAQEAEQKADDPAATISEVSRLVEKIAEMKSLLATLRPEYQVSMPYVFGGAGATTGALFTCQSPYDTAAEYVILSVAFLDAGTAVLSTSGDPTGFLLTTPNVTQQGMYGLRVFAATAAATISPADCWTPIQANGSLNFALNSSAKNAYVTALFRRRVNPAGVFNNGF